MSKQSNQVKVFIKDIIAIYKLHAMSISHEDSQGAFKIMDLSQENINWIKAASDVTTKEDKKK